MLDNWFGEPTDTSARAHRTRTHAQFLVAGGVDSRLEGKRQMIRGPQVYASMLAIFSHAYTLGLLNFLVCRTSLQLLDFVPGVTRRGISVQPSQRRGLVQVTIISRCI